MIIRVFPRRTSFTPTDDYACVGWPPLIRPKADEVHISTVFTWDVKMAMRLQEAWQQYYPVVKLGGPAFGNPANGFIPGMYIKHGVTFTTRGCNHNCPWCLVPEYEGKLKIMQDFAEGHIIQDNNILQSGPTHFAKVITMLRRLNRPAVFSGGLEAGLITDEVIYQLRSIKVGELYLACDTMASVLDCERAAQKLTRYFKRRQLRVYVLIGQGKADLCRLERMWEIGLLPFAQLYQPASGFIKYSQGYRDLAREWSRLAAMFASHKESSGLRFGEDVAAVLEVVKAPANGNLAKDEINVLPAKAQQLGSPHAGEKGRVKQGIVGAVLRGLEEPGNLIFIPGMTEGNKVIAQRIKCFLQIIVHPDMRKQHKGRERKNPLMSCPNCQKPILHGNNKTCSARCRHEQHWVKLVCPVCLKLFERKQGFVLSVIKKGRRDFYCGKSCWGKVLGQKYGRGSGKNRA